MVLGACAGLLLLAVAALGTTYTYRMVIARLAAAERAANNHIGEFGNLSAFLTEDDANEEDLQRLAARRDVDPLLEVHIHVAGSQHQPPTSETSLADAGSNASAPSATREALRSLLHSPQGTTEVFAMRSARWLATHHLDGLVLELGYAVSGAAPELVTRLAEISHRQLGRMGKSFTLVLPESNALFAQYDLDALLTTRGLYPIQRTHLTSDLRRASCPAPYQDPIFGIEHVLNRTHAALGSRRRRQGLSRLFFSVSLLGAHFVLDQEPGPNASVTFASAKFQGFMPYANMCQLIMSGRWNARANLHTDCTEANKGIEWASAFAPFSGDWILGFRGSIRGLAVFDVEGDDRDGHCGEKHVLLKRLRDLLS
ncbi:uncharacterized protein LOC144153533 [Haemaphysalis longicornis]